jgi:hypothetical protein
VHHAYEQAKSYRQPPPADDSQGENPGRAAGSSISGLLAEQIELLVGEDEAYERAQRRALALMDKGFHMGGVIRATRDEWHPCGKSVRWV